MPPSQPVDKQKEEAFYNMWEYYRDTYGYKPRHFSIDSMSLEDIQAVVDQIDDYHAKGFYKQDREDEEEEMRYYDMLDKYKDDEYAQQAEPHENDFYDTMNFSKDKSRLRDFPVVKEQQAGNVVVLDTGDQSSAPVVDPSSFDDEESDEELAARIAYTKKLTDEDPYRSVKSFDYDAAYADDDQDEFAGSTEEKFFSVKAPPRNPAKSLPLTDDDPYADFESFDDYKKDRDTKQVKMEAKRVTKTKVTKSQLTQLIKKVILQEQVAAESSEVSKVRAEIQEGLYEVRKKLAAEAKNLESKAIYIDRMIDSMHSTELGGDNPNMYQPGVAWPVGIVERGAGLLEKYFADFGYSDLASKIKWLVAKNKGG